VERAFWRRNSDLDNFRIVKKIVGVALLGGLVLTLVLLAARNKKANDGTGVPSAADSSQTSAASASAAPASPIVSAAAAPTTAATDDDEAACAHLADLCSTSSQKVDTSSCRAKLTDARKLSGPGNVARAEQCLAEAKTCAAASGCLSGGIGVGAAGEFLKGLGAALSK
jgi:hypothetical protein